MPDLSLLSSLVLAHLPADPERLHLRPVLTGKFNTSYWVESDLGSYVLRVAPPDDAGLLFYERRMMRQEPDLHALIRSRTTIPVAEIVAHDFTRTRIDRDYLLMRTLPGRPLSDVSLRPGAGERTLRAVGEYLAQLHQLTAAEALGRAEYGYLGAHAPLPPAGTWQEAFHAMWNRLLDDVVACGSYSPAEADALRALLDRHMDLFATGQPARLLHMDVWAQNILVDQEGNVTGLVDFDRALWGDPEIEYAVLDYCGISEPAFWRGYGRARDESLEAQIRRQFYLLYEVQKYMPIHVWRRADPKGAERYKWHSLRLALQLLQE